MYIETLGSLPEIAWEEKGMAKKGRRFDRNGKNDLVESALRIVQRCCIAGVKTLQRLHNQYQHITIPRGTPSKIRIIIPLIC